MTVPYAVVAEVAATNSLAGASGLAGAGLDLTKHAVSRLLGALRGGQGRNGGNQEGDGKDGDLSELHCVGS